ncbi:MAG TPA: PilX N-terminal domain-containing pilus assembly protein [Pseudomonas sp.]|nr:PilX N-terminal domain-containing pilus assembly protein [Pseudomonas sp.]
MNKSTSLDTRQRLPRQQNGASLLIALIILLVVTLLALSSVREVALESRITGNFVEQQKLGNSAESGLRDGEQSMTLPISPLEPSAVCPTADEGERPDACLLATKPTYENLFSVADKSRDYYPKDGTKPNIDTIIKWYALMAPTGGESGEAENPEYGNMLNQTGVFRYEVNSQATLSKTNNASSLRSTTAKFFDNGN